MPQPSTNKLSLSPKHAFWISAGAFAICGLLKKPGLGLAVAGGVALAAYKTANPEATEYAATCSFLLNASPEQAYTLWHNFAELPRFMSHLKSVRVLDETRSEWTAIGPTGVEASWRAEITRDVPNEQISWQSLPDSQIHNSGSVTFVPDPHGRGTLITAQVRYSLPFGPAAKALLTLLGKNPTFVLQEDVRRFKSLLEAGEAPTTQGQSHGPRGLSGKVKDQLFRETTNHPEPQAAEAPEAQPEYQPA